MSEDCLFCGIVAGDIDADVVYRGEHTIAFRDIQPKAPTHVLIVPKQHVRDWSDLAATAPELAQPLVAAVPAVAQEVGLDQYRVVANTGEKAGQSVFHLHLHVLGGRPMLWPPG